MTSFVNSLVKTSLLKLINVEDLLKCLNEISKNVDESLNYISPNLFDDLFLEFAIQTGLIKKFHQLIEKMPKFGLKKDIKNPNLFIPKPNLILKPIKKTFINDGDINFEDFTDTDSTSSLQNTEIFDKPIIQTLSLISVAPPVVFQDEPIEILEKVNSINFKDFNSFVQFFFVSLDPHSSTDKKKFIVMRCSSIRILFDLYYLENYSVLFGSICSKKFLQNCKNICEMTPKDLNINNIIININDIKMKDLIKFSNDFQLALLQFSLIDFYNNPLDISKQMFQALKNIEKGLESLSNTLKNNISVLNLSFDDIFSMILPVYAINPSSSPVSLQRFLNLFQDLKLSQSLEYANISLKAILTQLSI